MRNRLCNHIKNLLLPCLGFSMAVGFLSALLVTAFKLAAESVIYLSNTVYAYVRSNPIWLPAIILAAAAIGLLASIIRAHTHSCRGGGIPTSVAAIRGVISFKWITSIFILPFSALLTFLCGLPLGTEGPCVQMGTALGDGVVKCLGTKKQKGWRRYIMTGGASAGFSLATASPVTAIIFSMEELHKRFSPMLLTVASLSVIFAQIGHQILSFFGLGSGALFHLPTIDALDLKLLFAPLIVGAIVGVCSILFTRFYHRINKMMRAVISKISPKIVFPVLFACVALVGFFFSDSLGSGHHLVESIFSTQTIWYLIILTFLVRAIFMMISNTSGATGGIFLPNIAFGAMIGSLCAQGMIALGLIGSEQYLLMVVLGISSFLSSTSRIPITACVFAIEAMGGINNVLPILIATIISLLIVELSGLEDLTDTVIEARVHSINAGKERIVIEVPLTVKEDSFVIGKELRDILWPTSCVVVSFDRCRANYGNLGISAGDVLTVHYKTYKPEAAAKEFEILVGEQSDEIRKIMNPN